MKRCNYAALIDNVFSYNLEQIENGKYKLGEIEGTIISCESKREGLVMILKNEFNPENTNNKKIIWAFEKQMSIPAICGQELRAFYEKTYKRKGIEEIKMDAYELSGIVKGTFDNKGILRRGVKPSTNYKFVEFD